MFKSAALFCLLIILSGGEAFAEQACTQRGCIDGLMLKADPSFDWKPGLYNFDIVADNRKVRCYGSLPLKPCEDGPSLECDRDGVQIMESGCALPVSQQGFGDIHIADDPQKVLVRISRNNRPVVTRTIMPKYEFFHPNGPLCGPVCRSASYNLFDANR